MIRRCDKINLNSLKQEIIEKYFRIMNQKCPIWNTLDFRPDTGLLND